MSQDNAYQTELANPYAPPAAWVRDVSGPVEITTLAGRGGRFAASLLDNLFFGALVYLPVVVAAALAGPEEQLDAGADLSAGALLSLLIAFAGFVLFCWLNVSNMIRTGQSLGKKIIGIKVVRSDGSRASLAILLLKRNLLTWLLSIIPLYAFVDVLFIFGDSRQCIHDKLADTKVIEA